MFHVFMKDPMEQYRDQKNFDVLIFYVLSCLLILFSRQFVMSSCPLGLSSCQFLMSFVL